MTLRIVRTTSLELTDPAALSPARHPGPGVTFERLDRTEPELARFFYTAIGGDYYWVDRLPWTFAEWKLHLSRPGLETWMLSVNGVPAGYVELDAGSLPDAEVVIFGMIAAFAGRGLGAWMLERTLRRGLALGRRVWLRTCDLDSPLALPSYLARGLRVFRVEDREADLPDTPPGAWPGAGRRSGHNA